jgi:hypothetical protein
MTEVWWAYARVSPRLCDMDGVAMFAFPLHRSDYFSRPSSACELTCSLYRGKTEGIGSGDRISLVQTGTKYSTYTQNRDDEQVKSSS